MGFGAWIQCEVNLKKWMIVNVAFSALLLSGCGAPAYKIAPLNAVVVDATTGLPVEGVHVLADWELVRGGLDGQHVTGHLGIKETVTDHNGQFHFDGFVATSAISQELRNADPRLYFFKSGYQVGYFSNSYPVGGTDTPGWERHSQLDGRKMKLRTMLAGEEGPHAYLSFDTDIWALSDNCNWKKFPLLLLAMMDERERLKAKYGREPSLPTIRGIEARSNGLCGDPAQFFEGIKQ